MRNVAMSIALITCAARIDPNHRLSPRVKLTIERSIEYRMKYVDVRNPSL